MRKGFLVVAFMLVFAMGFMQATEIYFDPQTQYADIGSTVFVDIYVDNVTEFYSYQFDVLYDPTILQFVNITFGPFLSSDGAGVFNVEGNSSTPGYIINHASTRTGTSIGVNGTGIVSTIAFTTLIQDNSTLSFENVLLYDSVPQEIPFTSINGSINSLECDVDNDGVESFICGGLDCNDNNPDEFPGQTWYEDLDSDLYSSGTTQVVCARPSGYNLSTELTALSGDCNDGDSAINPGATEICDGVDNDCSVATTDGSGETAPLNTLQDGVCSTSTQSCTSGAWTDDYSGVSGYESGTELTCDGLDNDCDASTDESLTTEYYGDSDSDTYGSPTNTTQACNLPSGYVTNNLDCNDGDTNINPGATEICDGVDNDCSVATTDGSGETAPLNTLQDGVCSLSTQSCTSGAWTDDYSGVANYDGTNESTCFDVLDNDCDVDVDLDDLDCVYLLYDLNGDGMVNIADISVSALSFGASCSSGDNWCSGRDVNRDGVVNILDLSLIGMNFT